MSGHVLSIDADRGRECHPWIMLAKKWESEDLFDCEDGELIVRPPRRVWENDSEVRGVFVT